MTTPQCVLLLDAWDEVPVGKDAEDLAGRPVLLAAAAATDADPQNLPSALGERIRRQGIQWYFQQNSPWNSFHRSRLLPLFSSWGEFALPCLLPLLGDAGMFMCMNAAEALGRIGDPAAVPHLIARLGDANAYVRARVAEALTRIGQRHKMAISPPSDTPR